MGANAGLGVRHCNRVGGKPEVPSRVEMTECKEGALEEHSLNNPHLITPIPSEGGTTGNNQPRTLTQTFVILSHLGEPFRFHLRPIQGM